MIVPMKKVTLLLGARHRDSGLQQLRKLGVLHIQDINVPAGEDIQDIETRIESVNRALSMLEPTEGEAKKKKVKPEAVVENVLEMSQRKDSLNRELSELRTMEQWFDLWGDASYASVQKLNDAGVFIRLYVTDKSGLKDIPADVHYEIVNEVQNADYLALISESAD